MSTKAIRKVLRDMACDESPCRNDVCRKHEALVEVEAIERAAKDLEAWQTAPAKTMKDKVRLGNAATKAFELLSSIAKENK